MNARPQPQLTVLLRAAQAGDKQAASELFPCVYDELRRIARHKMANVPPGQTLQPTALVHEVFLKFVDDPDQDWRSRRYFFGAAARAMRDIIVDQARRKSSLKRGGDRKRESYDEQIPIIEPPTEDVVGMHNALKRLEAEDPRKGQIVNLRYFAGLTNEDTASALELSVGTIKRELRYAKAWLHREMTDAGNDAPK